MAGPCNFPIGVGLGKDYSAGRVLTGTKSGFITRATFGKLRRAMRNKVTNLLIIVVVPWHTAGGG